MGEYLWGLIGLLAVAGLLFTVRRWRRRQKAADLAEALLADVLKAKDSYRR